MTESIDVDDKDFLLKKLLLNVGQKMFRRSFFKNILLVVNKFFVVIKNILQQKNAYVDYTHIYIYLLILIKELTFIHG